MNKNIFIKIDGADLKEILPVDPRVKIEHFFIGAETIQSSYIKSIKSNGYGQIWGGGTATHEYLSYDFGFGVENTSDTNMRVQLKIVQVDQEGYTIKEFFPWVDVKSGEKNRIWADISITKKFEFQFYRIMEIGIGITPVDGANEIAICSTMTSPKKSIYDIFDFKNNSLPSKFKNNSTGTKSSKFQYIQGLAVIIAIIAFLKIVALILK